MGRKKSKETPPPPSCEVCGAKYMEPHIILSHLETAGRRGLTLEEAHHELTPYLPRKRDDDDFGW